MQKLVCAVMVACSMVALAAEEAKKEAAPAAAPAKAQVQPPRAKLTPEQRAEMRAKREKFFAERKAALEAKMLEVAKKYVPEEEKAKALIKDLQDVMMSSRRGMMRRPVPAGAK